jgi:hypothetical protein
MPWSLNPRLKGLERAQPQFPRGQESICSQAPVAHACNPLNSGGRDQEDCSSKPAQANSLQDPISKTPITKKGPGGKGREMTQTLYAHMNKRKNKKIYKGLMEWLKV